MHRRTALQVGAALLAGGIALPTHRDRDEDPYAPLGNRAVPGATEVVAGPPGHATLATTDGFAIVDIGDPAAPRLVAERRDILADRDDDPMRAIQDVHVAGDRLLVVGPAHDGSGPRGALYYDVSDPAAPERIAVFETSFPIHNATVADGVAYLTGNDGEANPIVVIDLEAGVELARWSLLDADPAWEAVHEALRPCHDVHVRGDRLYGSYWDAGTWIIDVSDPAAPSALGRVGDRSAETLAGIERVGPEAATLPGNHHSASTNTTGTLLAIGHEAWSIDPELAPGGIGLWDIRDPAAPVHRATIPPPPTPDPSRNGTWTTAHNFELAEGRLYSAWYQGGVKIHDVSRPDQPRELAWWRDPSKTRFWAARRANGVVIASSIGVNEADAALFIFPDRPGEQPDPPSLTEAEPSMPTPTRSPTPSPTDAPSPSERHGGARTTDRSPAGHHSGHSHDVPTTATPGQAGMRAVGTILALGSLTWLRRRRSG